MTTLHMSLSRLNYEPRHQARDYRYPTIPAVKPRTMQSVHYVPRHAEPEN